MYEILWAEKFYIEGYIQMNNYPSWWDTTVTIYNKYENAQTQLVTWYKHIVHGCFWKYHGEKVVINDVVLDTKSILCRIRLSDEFLEKHEWIAKPNDQMSNYFTLGQGDIIVKGEVDDVINEYQPGYRSSDLKAKYKALQGCMEIQEWANNTGGGRGIEHYFARGI